MSRMQKLLDEIDRLKPMPKIAGQIMGLIQKPNSSFEEIADLICYEPVISAEVLKTCNSAFYGLPRTIDSVQDAISILGLDRIIELVLLKCSTQNLAQKQNGYGLKEGELWRHAVFSAVIAKDLATRFLPAQKHLIFTAALLKDIGKVVLDQFVEGAFQHIHQMVQEKEISFLEAEKQTFGIDHAELGGIVARKWKLSRKMVNIITNHHLTRAAGEDDPDPETALVYLSDTICMMIGIGVGADGLAYRFHEEILSQFKITAVQLQEYIAEFEEKISEVDAMFETM